MTVASVVPMEKEATRHGFSSTSLPQIASLDSTNCRTIHINDDKKNELIRTRDNHTGNTVSTSKYTVASFIPKTLLEFFRVVANQYFLLISILQVATPWSPTNKYTTAGPLLIVLAVAMIKQAIEDRKRHQADEIQNHRTCQIVDANGKITTKFWFQVCSGDILKICDREEIPADVLILATSEEEHRGYVETSNLDGETNLKRRIALSETAKLAGWRALNEPVQDVDITARNISQIKARVEYEKPNDRLYNFAGRIFIDGKTEPKPIGPENIILRGCTLRSCSYMFGLVLFAGAETKLMQNARATPSKQSNVYKMVNRCILLIFLTQFILCLISTIYNGMWTHKNAGVVWYLPYVEEGPTIEILVGSFFTFLMLYNNLVPISLYVSLDMIKVAQAKLIGLDPIMSHDGVYALARTSDLNEELGQIQYIFSDKTGTLTQNVMEFRKCSINGTTYGFGTTEIGRAVAKLASSSTQVEEDDTFGKKAPASPIVSGLSLSATESDDSSSRSNADKLCNKQAAQVHLDPSISFDDIRLLQTLEGTNASVNLNVNNPSKDAEAIDDFLTILSVCHTVLPEWDALTNRMEYRASSPDEEALVKAARCFGYEFITPAPNLTLKIKGKTVAEQTRWYTVLNINEFSSARKRMSVVVWEQRKDPNDRNHAMDQKEGSNENDSSTVGTYTLYCKGADNVIFERATPQDYSTLVKDINQFASEGLRTLVLAKRSLTQEEYERWNQKYTEAASQLTHRTRHLELVAEEIEHDLDIVGVTAIEDKLQVGVPSSIATLAQAGIKIWVLTGDKEETAINIGYACRLIDNNMKLLKLCTSDGEQLTSMVNALYAHPDLEYYMKNKKSSSHLALVCDGMALVHVFPGPSKSANSKDLEAARDLSRKLLAIARCCRAVIACRVSPAQKADIVSLVKNHSEDQPITLAIGDGANDVHMIQTAHVGVGISGLEGVQAVNASDYAIAQFRFLTPLLLHHGRLNYKRICKVIVYSFYKNFSLVVTLFFFNFFNGHSGSSLFESFLMAGWNFFLALPIIAIGIFDEDVDVHQVLRYPRLYQPGQQNEDLNIRPFVYWIGTAILHACICFFLPLGFGWEHPQGGLFFYGTLLYSGLLMTMKIKVVLLTRLWNKYHFASFASSVLLFCLFLAIYPKMTFISSDMRGVSHKLVTSAIYWLALLLVPFSASLLDVVIQYWYAQYKPEPADILREKRILTSKAKVKDNCILVRTTQLNQCRSNNAPLGNLSVIEEETSSMSTYSGYAFNHAESGIAEDDDLLGGGASQSSDLVALKVNAFRKSQLAG